MGWMSAIWDAHKKKVDVELLYNSVHRKFNQLGIRRVGEKMLEWEHVPGRLGPQDPSWAAQENGKETRLWPIEWGSICCSSVQSPTPSHTQPFQIKWEVYFSKNCVAPLYCVVVMMHGYIWVCILGYCYTTLIQGEILLQPTWGKGNITRHLHIWFIQ